ncbi:MAG: translation initiation factor [Deferrisomatales bacterium]|nr:translation initiation factor [Deferrisomatales bacterium]
MEKRRGKPVTVAALEGLDPEAQRVLGKELKARCGSGGTVKAGAVELQGDHRETLRALLPQRGVRVKG